MSEFAERYRRIAGEFTRRVEAVADDAWDSPAPCEGWVARDVVRHLVEWIPSVFYETWGIEGTTGPSVDDDPLGAWRAMDTTIQSAFDDPEVATAERDTRMGKSSFEQNFDQIATNDVFMHTWDLARATGLDEKLDPGEVHKLLIAMEPYDEVLRSSGHYGPKVEVPADADEQTKLLAFIGRHP